MVNTMDASMLNAHPDLAIEIRMENPVAGGLE